MKRRSKKPNSANQHIDEQISPPALRARLETLTNEYDEASSTLYKMITNYVLTGGLNFLPRQYLLFLLNDIVKMMLESLLPEDIVYFRENPAASIMLTTALVMSFLAGISYVLDAVIRVIANRWQSNLPLMPPVNDIDALTARSASQNIIDALSLVRNPNSPVNLLTAYNTVLTEITSIRKSKADFVIYAAPLTYLPTVGKMLTQGAQAFIEENNINYAYVASVQLGPLVRIFCDNLWYRWKARKKEQYDAKILEALKILTKDLTDVNCKLMKSSSVFSTYIVITFDTRDFKMVRDIFLDKKRMWLSYREMVKGLIHVLDQMSFIQVTKFDKNSIIISPVATRKEVINIEHYSQMLTQFLDRKNKIRLLKDKLLPELRPVERLLNIEWLALDHENAHNHFDLQFVADIYAVDDDVKNLLLQELQKCFGKRVRIENEEMVIDILMEDLNIHFKAVFKSIMQVLQQLDENPRFFVTPPSATSYSIPSLLSPPGDDADSPGVTKDRDPRTEPIEKRKHQTDLPKSTGPVKKIDKVIKPPARVDWPHYKSYIHADEIAKSEDDVTRVVTVRNPRDEHLRYNRFADMDPELIFQFANPTEFKIFSKGFLKATTAGDKKDPGWKRAAISYKADGERHISFFEVKIPNKDGRMLIRIADAKTHPGQVRLVADKWEPHLHKR